MLLTLGARVPIQRCGNYFARAGLYLWFFKISILGSVQSNVVNRLESNDQKNMDLKTSFAVNQICIVGKFYLT